MASLHRHLQLQGADHDRLDFRPDCPHCQHRLAGTYPDARLMSRRTGAAAAAGLVAASALAPTAPALAKDDKPVGVPDPSSPPAVVKDPHRGGGDMPPLRQPRDDRGPPSTVPRLPTPPKVKVHVPRPDQPLRQLQPKPAPEHKPAPEPPQSAPAPPPAPKPKPKAAPPAAPPKPTAPAPQPEAPSKDPSGDERQRAPRHAQAPNSSSGSDEGSGRASRGDARESDRAASAGPRKAGDSDPPGGAAAKASKAETSPGSAHSHKADPTATSDAGASASSHRVRPGESLWLIAEQTLGGQANDAQVAAEVQRLWQLNAARIGTGDPNLVYAGQELRTR